MTHSPAIWASTALLCVALGSGCAAGESNSGPGGDGGSDAGVDGSAVDAGADASSTDGATIDGPACVTNADCENDSRCVGHVCAAWGPGDFDPSCQRSGESGGVRPLIQCGWPGDRTDFPEPNSISIDQTPLVANLRIATSVELPPRPSIVFITDEDFHQGPNWRNCTSVGVLRVVDGATCDLQASVTATENRVYSAISPAIADLDSDGVAEIVAARAQGGLIAFHWDAATSSLVRSWVSTNSDGSEDRDSTDSTGFTCLMGAITISDLDDVAGAEIIFGDTIYSASGVVLGRFPDWERDRNLCHMGAPFAAADVDLDGMNEIITGQGIYQWNGTTMRLEKESYWTGDDPLTGGLVAIGDFGEFPEFEGDVPGRPEIIFAYSGGIDVRTTTGTRIFTAGISDGLPWHGGPPTVADFDGDGKPEVGIAFGNHYSVFDVIDRTVSWSQMSQDTSSQVTGSSVFDFDADGRAEVVYGDECYTRIYDGSSGKVVFSQPRFSSTWLENPVIADVDHDNAAEIVVVSGATPDSCAIVEMGYCPAFDPIFDGVACLSDDECGSGHCLGGLCRCTSDDECSAAYACTDPIDGSEAMGNVCRSHFEHCDLGLTVYRDARDYWASSRDLWNQHAYSITNINDDLTVPRSSEQQRNWEVAGYNNFRQNVQTATLLSAADLTVRNLDAACEGENTRLSAEVCNRGEALTDLGIEIIFRQVGAGTELCRLRTTAPISGGECTPVECVAEVRAEGDFEGVVDPDTRINECEEDNNEGTGTAHCLL